jgi:HEAT repeat protein
LVAPLPTPRVNASAVEGADGRIYLFSGGPFPAQPIPGEPLLRIYSPKENQWIAGSAACTSARPFYVGIITLDDEPGRKGGYSQVFAHDSRCSPGNDSQPWRPSGGATDSHGRPIWMAGASSYVFDPAEDHWLAVTRARTFTNLGRYEGPIPEWQHFDSVLASAPDGRIYAIGGAVMRFARRHGAYSPKLKMWRDSGSSRNSSGFVEIFDPETGAWSSAPPMRIPRAAAAAAFGADGKLYVFGGQYRKQSFNDELKAEESALKVSLGIDPTTQLPYNDQPELATDLAYVEAYDPATGEWTLRAPMPVARSHASAVLARDGRIYLLGCPVAWRKDERQEPCVYVYDPASDSWEEGPPLRVPRYSISAVATRDGRIYALGGSTYRNLTPPPQTTRVERGSPRDEVEILTIEPRAPQPRIAEPLPALTRSKEAVAQSLAALATGAAAAELPALYQLEFAVTSSDPEALGPLTRELASGDPNARRSALRALARMKAMALPAASQIAALLDDPAPWLHWAALDTLSAIGADRQAAIPMLIARLRTDDFADLFRATHELGKIGAAAVPALEEELRDPNHPSPDECVEALAEIGLPAERALIAALDTGDTNVRSNALFGLAMIHDTSYEAARAIEKLLRDPGDPKVAWLAVFALSRVGPPGEEVLLRALQDPRVSVRLASAWALSDSRPSSEPVREALQMALAAVPSDGNPLSERQRHAFEAALAVLDGRPVPEIPRPAATARAPEEQPRGEGIVVNHNGQRFLWNRSGY